MLIHCAPKQDAVERYIEDGVEVVVNHIEPYQISGRRSLSLELLFSIDTEQEEILELGIPDILGFDVNSRGEIFLVRGYAGDGDFVYIFDGEGSYTMSFGAQGEGPGELQNPRHIVVDGNNDILITDIGRYPLQKYNSEGEYLGGHELKSGVVRISTGHESRLLVQFMSVGQGTTGPIYTFELSLQNPEFQELKLLDKLSFSPMMDSGKVRGTEPVFFWSVSKDNIYIANEERGYEVWMHDSSGNLVRKIRKEYVPKSMTQDLKNILSTNFPENMRTDLSFPEKLPPIQSIVAADDGILLVSTYDDGANPGEFMFDVFSKGGVFVARKSLNAYSWEGHMWMRIRENRLYSLEVKESGYKELVVYKMIWQ
jgi:hypothetical protein